MELKKSDLNDLKKAKKILENTGIAAKITNFIGTPIEKGFELLPDNWNKKIEYEVTGTENIPKLVVTREIEYY